MCQKRDNDDYANVETVDRCLYEFATIEEYYKIPWEAARKIEVLFERLRWPDKENH